MKGVESLVCSSRGAGGERALDRIRSNRGVLVSSHHDSHKSHPPHPHGLTPQASSVFKSHASRASASASRHAVKSSRRSKLRFSARTSDVVPARSHGSQPGSDQTTTTPPAAQPKEIQAIQQADAAPSRNLVVAPRPSRAAFEPTRPPGDHPVITEDQSVIYNGPPRDP